MQTEYHSNSYRQRQADVNEFVCNCSYNEDTTVYSPSITVNLASLKVTDKKYFRSKFRIKVINL
jgi:hypothetical protein